MKFTTGCLAIIGAIFALAPAQALMPTAIIFQPDSPVRIDRCLGDTRSGAAGTPGFYFDFAAYYSNGSRDTIGAVRLRFDIFNAFGEHLRAYYGMDDDTTLAAGASRNDISENTHSEELDRQLGGSAPPIYLPTWEFVNTSPTAHTVVCSVDTVMVGEEKWQAKPPTAKAFKFALRDVKREPGFFHVTSD